MNWREYYIHRHKLDAGVPSLLSVLFSGKEAENRPNKLQARTTLKSYGILILDKLYDIANDQHSNFSLVHYAKFISNEISHAVCLESW